MFNNLFFLILCIVTVDFLFATVVGWLNRRATSPLLPNTLLGIYNQKEYARQQLYFKANNAFSSGVRFVEYIIMMVMLFVGGFGILDGWAYDLMPSPVLAALFFFAIIYIGNDLLTLPLSYYRTFVIEQRFGFNKMTRKLFFQDTLKQIGLSIFIGGFLIAAIFLLYQHWNELFWLYAWGIICGFTVFFSLFYSNLIVPLFNRQKPLPAGELREAIEQFADQIQFPLKDIYIIDGSKRSTKANAYFSGFGRNKRIVLYDTLLKELDTRETLAVLAHEIGHYHYRHTLQGLFLSVFNSFILLYVFSLLVENQSLAVAMGGKFPTFELGLIAFTLLYSPVGLVTGVLFNLLSRRNEYQADAFAARCGLAQPLVDALKKLSVKSLSNLTPSSVFVFVYYSHPTLLQRMKRLGY